MKNDQRMKSLKSKKSKCIIRAIYVITVDKATPSSIEEASSVCVRSAPDY